jgi:hypothetical protein
MLRRENRSSTKPRGVLKYGFLSASEKCPNEKNYVP